MYVTALKEQSAQNILSLKYMLYSVSVLVKKKKKVIRIFQSLPRNQFQILILIISLNFIDLLF